MKQNKTVILLLAAGSGSRMKSSTPKQFMLLDEKPLICYCLDTIEACERIDTCVLVTSEKDMAYMKEEILQAGNYEKVKVCCTGGRERYLSVYEGIKAYREYCREAGGVAEDTILMIQDGARPFLSPEIIERTCEAAETYGACVAAMPSKDTVKISDENGFASMTPNRNTVWTVQTPQVFRFSVIESAYRMLIEREDELAAKGIVITDDAMVVETMLEKPVKLVEGSYENIKVTTPEDIPVAEAILKNKFQI